MSNPLDVAKERESTAWRKFRAAEAAVLDARREWAAVLEVLDLELKKAEQAAPAGVVE